MTPDDGQGAIARPEKEISHEHEKQTCDGSRRERHAEGCGTFENQKGHAAAIGAFADGVKGGEAGLPILRQRRPGAVLQEATRCPMPRLFQTALQFSVAGQASRETSEHKG